jgi:hypothetical protein
MEQMRADYSCYNIVSERNQAALREFHVTGSVSASVLVHDGKFLDQLEYRHY